jgi:hypothetical protein
VVKIPPDAIIPEEKLTRYLLVPRPEDDKSRYLAQAGFTNQNPAALLAAIRDLTTSDEAVEDGSNRFGDFFRVEGAIIGPNGRRLLVVLVWLRWFADGTFHFVTLKPWKGPRDEA